MKNYMLDVMNEGEPGLFLCELPTGIGKSYTSALAMKKYADTITDNRKIIYLTTLKKNILETELKKAYGSADAYKKAVLRIRSNFDEVVEKINNIEVPLDMQSDTYNQLCKDVESYNKAISSNYEDKEYIKDLSKRINNGDDTFRHEIRLNLKKSLNTVEERKEAIKFNKYYKWIGQLYPAVFTDDYKILLMSVSKFIAKNSILIDRSYDFITSELVDNAKIIIDEFDATKDTIQSGLIKKSLKMKEDYIQLFKRIYSNLNANYFSKEIIKAKNKADGGAYGGPFSDLLEEAAKINLKYHLNLSIKTKEDYIDKKQVFLFNDASFHTVLEKGKKYIRATLNEDENKIDVFFENKETFYKNRNTNSDIVLYSMLRDINAFLIRFRTYSIEWARHYMIIINEKRDANKEAMKLEDAISSILKRLGLTNNQINLLMGETCQMIKDKNEQILENRSFYQLGMEYYEFEDNDSHHDNSNLRFVKVYDTPEKIVLSLAQRATVFGVSATAEIATVVGNYDLNYLEEELKENFHRTPQKLKEQIKKALNRQWSAYRDGRIQLHSEIIDSNIGGLRAEEYCKSFLDNETARYAANIIENTVEEKYQIARYCNLLKVMCFFIKTVNIKSMLYLGMALPRKNNPAMDEKVIRQLFDYAKQSLASNNTCKMVILRGDNFEADKKELEKSLAKGEKIFVISSYPTIGAGQNLQYKIPEDANVVYLGKASKNDKRYLYKDFDAIYLGDITHMTVNTYQNEKIPAEDLLKMLFQIEELYENNEINYEEKDELLKLAFRSYTGNIEYQFNKIYKLKSVIVQAGRTVLQAVGRICRTFVKNPDIYIFIESQLLDKLYIGELEKRILPPEMQTIVELCKQLGKTYLPEENIKLNLAEKKSSETLWHIKRLLAKNWTAESMRIWEQLRLLVLKYPTASSQEYQADEYLQKFYITSGVKQNSYIYSQYSDFKDVTIDFGSDKIAFKNSKRAKVKGESNELAIYEMSEAESGLQAILKYSGMYEFFIKNSYATEFKENEFLMSPVLFHNIYKGALGEAAGKYILQRELGIKLQPITEPDYFEFFDFKLSDKVYIDFKNWKFSYVQDNAEIRENILAKLEYIGGKRVYIINVTADRNYKTSISVDQRLIEIPMLIKNDGTICHECLKMLKREDFENVNE